jgi:serine/threonine protein phosphatase PrpC
VYSGVVAGRASIVGAAATHVGKVREHNEDAHFIDVDLGLFLVCDGMGGHAAGEVASALAIRSIRHAWASAGMHDIVEQWLDRGTADAKKRLLEVVRGGVLAAHDAILTEAGRDDTKTGMGTTLVGAMVVGGELWFAHAGDSRAYLVRDGISMQLTEDHTLLARLLAAGIEVDVSGEGSRFRSMLTNALGIGDECKVSTFVVPLADGDRFLLCSDGISEYVPENEVGDVLTKQPSPARAAQRLIDLALERGGGDNATAVVVRVLEAGETPLPAEQRKKDDAAISVCALWGTRVTPQQRLRALRIAIPRDHNFGEKLPAHALGDRVAWIIVEGEAVQDGAQLGPGTLVYPESLVNLGAASPMPERDALAITRSDVRALAIRADDFREMCEDDGELGEALLESLAQVIARRKGRGPAREQAAPVDAVGNTDPHLHPVSSARAARREAAEAYRPTDPDIRATQAAEDRERAETAPDEPVTELYIRARPPAESPIIAPVSPRAPVPQPPSRPSPPPPRMTRPTPPPAPPARPSPPPARLKQNTPPSSSPPPAAATRPSPPPAQLQARARPPTPPATPAVRPSPPPAQLQRPHSPSQPPPPPARPSPPPAQLQRAHPTTPPPARAHPPSQPPAPPARPSTPPPARANPPSQPPGPPARASTPTPAPAAAAAPKGFAPALTPPSGRPIERPSTPPATVASHSPSLPRLRPPTDPEIETYLEIEADEPPESGLDAELESELALSIAFSGDLERIDAPVPIALADGSARTNETATDEHARITVTVSEPAHDHSPVRKRAITAQDSSSVSGTISIPEDGSAPPPRRAKRQSDGWDD